jgi:hypothetical protein
MCALCAYEIVASYLAGEVPGCLRRWPASITAMVLATLQPACSISPFHQHEGSILTRRARCASDWTTAVRARAAFIGARLLGYWAFLAMYCLDRKDAEPLERHLSMEYIAWTISVRESHGTPGRPLDRLCGTTNPGDRPCLSPCGV